MDYGISAQTVRKIGRKYKTTGSDIVYIHQLMTQIALIGALNLNGINNPGLTVRFDNFAYFKVAKNFTEFCLRIDNHCGIMFL